MASSGRVVGVLVTAVMLLAAGAPAASELQQTVADATGSEPTAADGVVRVGWARDDVSFTISGMPLEPAAGLGSWAAFKPTGGGVLMTGDTVVFEDEITPAMDAAFAHGLEVTALHNHFIYGEPPVFFMHISGTGDAGKLGRGVEAVWAAIRSVREKAPVPQRRLPEPMPSGGDRFDEPALQEILGTPPQPRDGVIKFSFPRQGSLAGAEAGGPMGLATWAAFSGGQEHAFVDGDFIMTGDEVQAVMRTLRDHDIHVVALHNHMIEDEPRFFFLHYMGVGPAEALAAGVRAALDSQKR